MPPESSEPQPKIDAELKALSRCTIHELRARWKDVFQTEIPRAFGPDLLRRSIAHELQLRAYGGLKDNVRRELDRLVKALNKNPAKNIELPRRIKPGSVLVREWKGQTHLVSVTEVNFSYNGKSYSALSKIAREITGTRWNGPRFFGLRKASENKNQQDKTSLAAGALPS
jgi:hypothetical protein